MIDWITATIECDHDPDKVQSGYVISLDSKGQSEWVVNKALSVEGSHSTKIQIKSLTDTKLYISGNPVKFLQGHNLFGTDDLKYLFNKFFEELLKKDLGLKPTDIQKHKIKQGNYELLRVDCTQTWLLGSIEEVTAWIRALGNKGRLKRRGSGVFTGDTMYFGKNSRRSSFKFYSKGTEIKAKGHKLPEQFRTPEMIDYANKSLRAEATLRAMELKRLGLNNASVWTPEHSYQLLYTLCIGNLELSENMALPDELTSALPLNLRSAYVLWKQGEDLRQTMAKATFYKYRKLLLEYGIDIAIVQEAEQTSNVIPLIRYLEAAPAKIPDWAYQQNLVA